jgi:hypothetical protein
MLRPWRLREGFSWSPAEVGSFPAAGAETLGRVLRPPASPRHLAWLPGAAAGIPDDVPRTARWLTQVVTRNHVEALAMAIRRIPDPGKDPRAMSLGRLLREMAMYRRVLGDELGERSTMTSSCSRRQQHRRNVRRTRPRRISTTTTDSQSPKPKT